MSTIGTAYVQIAPSTKGLSGAMNKFFSDEGDKAGQTLGKRSGMGFLKSGFAGAVAGAFQSVTTKAIDLVKNSFEGAISRYDTIKNFPKVMQNFGISGEDAAAAMDKLQGALQKIPTTMDSAVMGVQRITSSTGDVDKATDIFIALNNAILAGGTPMETQASAMEQFTQAFSKGKPDMMEWRALQSAMPAQLNQVAAAMGYGAENVSQLGEDLRNGKIPMSDFTDTLISLNEKGLEGFPSLAEQAANATGGIGTSVANMKTAVVRGLANMIGKIDEAANDNGLPTFAETIGAISEGIDKAFTFIGEIIGRVSKTIQDFMASDAGKRMAETFRKLSDAAEGFGGPGEIILKIFEGIATFFMGVGAAILEIINGIREGIEKFANSPAGEKLRQTFSDIGEKFREITGSDGPSLVGFLEGLGKVFSVIAQGIGYAVLGVATAIKGIIIAVQAVINFVKGVINVISTIVNAIKTFFTETIPNAFLKFVEIVSFIPMKIIGFFRDLPGRILGFFVALGEKIGTFFKELPGKIAEFFQNLPQQIAYLLGFVIGSFVRWIADMVTTAARIGVEIIEAIVTFFKELPGKIWDFLVEAVTNLAQWIVDMAANAVRVGVEIIEAIVNFFKELPGKIWDFLVEAVTNLAQWVSDMVTNAKDVGSQVIDAIVTFFKELPGKILDALSTLWDTIKETFTSIPGKIEEGIKGIFDIGKHLIEGLWNGIKAMGTWLKEKITGFARTIIDGFKSGFGVSSPSKLTAAIGGFLVQGLQKGVARETSGLLHYLDGVAADIVGAFSLSTSVGSFSGNVAFGSASPAEYKQVIINQQVQPANTLLDVYNATKFGVNAAVAV